MQSRIMETSANNSHICAHIRNTHTRMRMRAHTDTSQIFGPTIIESIHRYIYYSTSLFLTISVHKCILNLKQNNIYHGVLTYLCDLLRYAYVFCQNTTLFEMRVIWRTMGRFLIMQNPADVVEETVIDCRPSVLPVSIPLSGLSPGTVSEARECVSYRPSEETGKSIMDMDTN